MTSKDQSKRAGDILQEKLDFNADWKMEDLKADFVLRAYEDRHTGYGPAVILICERDGEEHRAVTWSTVLVDQVHQLARDLPLMARVEEKRGQHGSYYTLA